MLECNMKKTTREFVKVSDVKNEKMQFHQPKEAFNVKDVDIKKILTSDEFAYDKNRKSECKILHWI